MSIRLHHVNVVVPVGGTEKVAGFYADVVGLRQVPKPTEGVSAGGAWFDLDDARQLHLSERDDAVVLEDMHFAVVVDDFDGILERIRGAGAPWWDEPQIFGARRGSTRDPLGNRVEVLEAW